MYLVDSFNLNITAMKKPILIVTFLFITTIFFSNCNKDKNENNSGAPGLLGEVGNTWNVKVNGTYDLSTEIIAKEGNIVTLQVCTDALI